MKKNKLTKGFTLIELLVVIAIIGILGAIIYAPFQSARRKGRDSQRVVEMKNLISSLALYADSHGGYYPCTLAALASTMSDPLPELVNASSSNNSDPTKYNYVGYTDGTTDTSGNGSLSSGCNVRVLGFHLWTHLETANGALSGAAKCRGVTTTMPPNPDACIRLKPASGSYSGGTIISGQDEPTSVAFTLTERKNSGVVQDDDKICATNKKYCILDYHQ